MWACGTLQKETIDSISQQRRQRIDSRSESIDCLGSGVTDKDYKIILINMVN